MNIRVSNEYEGDDFRNVLSFAYKKTAEQVVTEVLKEAGCPYEAEADIRLVSNSEMRRLNREARGIDRATDVLSFPMTQYGKPGNFSELKKGHADSFNPENGCLMLGDIVISVDRVRTQAREYGHSAKREYAFLIAHSVLHLIGYDHMNDTEAEVMQKRQSEALEALGITRDGGVK
jgi:probable rRNA maturation factor